MPKIIIAGGGNGGLVAGYHLAKKGYSVTIFEKNEKESIGLSQTDAIDTSAFTYAEIPPAPYFKRGKNEITFVPLHNDVVESLTIPEQDEVSYLVDRKELANYLFSLAEKAGVEIKYGEEVVSPILLGNRVCGIKTHKGEYYGDLVIDACGVNSPVRNALPDYLHVNREIKPFDILYSYRGYFNKIDGVEDPKTTYNLYLKDNGTVGFSWLITEIDRVDALICRFYKPQDSEISEKLCEIHSENPQMGLDLIYGGNHSIIPVCQPLAVLVADGYAAIGDSAFMTFAIKGSGIAYSMKAGKMLADCIINDANQSFDCEALWEYQKRFFKEIGFSACQIALFKNVLPYLTAEDASEFFRLKLVSSNELKNIFENKGDAVLNKAGLLKIKDRIKLAKDSQTVKDILGNILKWSGRLAVLQTQFPNKFNKKEIAEWNEKYNEFFDSIRKQ